MPNSDPYISVVLATRNRGARLPAMLDALATAGAGTTAQWELVVVDNGSQDDTVAVLTDYAARTDFPVKVVSEPRPGLSRARNRGIAEARGAVLAFTDDDCLVAADWLDVMARAFADDPGLALLGGQVVLADLADAPVSLRPFADPCPITDFESLYAHLIGCNVAVRRRALDAIGPFDECLGAGTRSDSAEDLDLFYRLFRTGHRMRYDPRLRLRHAHGRRATNEVTALRRGYLRGRGAFYAKYMLQFDVEIWRRFLWEILGMTHAPVSEPAPADLTRLASIGALVRGIVQRLLPV